MIVDILNCYDGECTVQYDMGVPQYRIVVDVEFVQHIEMFDS